MFGKRTSLTYMPSPVMKRLDLSGLMERPMNRNGVSAIGVKLAAYKTFPEPKACHSRMLLSGIQNMTGPPTHSTRLRVVVSTVEPRQRHSGVTTQDRFHQCFGLVVCS